MNLLYTSRNVYLDDILVVEWEEEKLLVVINLREVLTPFREVGLTGTPLGRVVVVALRSGLRASHLLIHETSGIIDHHNSFTNSRGGYRAMAPSQVFLVGAMRHHAFR